MIVTGSTNPVLIVLPGPIRPMQIPIASAAKSGKQFTLTVPIYFPKNVPTMADTRMIEVEQPQTYTFPKKYFKHPITMMYHEESDKKFFVKQPIGDDSDNNGSEDEDLSWFY